MLAQLNRSIDESPGLLSRTGDVTILTARTGKGIQRSLWETPTAFECEFPWRQYASYETNDVLARPWPTEDPFAEDSQLDMPPGIVAELTVEHWFKRNEVERHPNAIHHFQPRAGLDRFRTIPEGDASRKSFKRLHRWRYSPTAAYGNNEVHLHPYKVRRLSAAEAMAIQSLPKNFVLPEGMSLSDMFKAIGNGVPFLAAQALARTLVQYLEKQE
jgi:DNA (cytosine-5)-methyltransferase 1